MNIVIIITIITIIATT